MSATNDPAMFANNAPSYTAVLPDETPSKEVFPGINVQVMWRGDNGATAAVVTIGPGAKWG